MDIQQSLWCMAGVTLPIHRSLPLPLGRYSFSVSLRIGGWVDLSGWLHIKMVHPLMITHLSTNWDRCRLTSFIWPVPLPVVQTATWDIHIYITGGSQLTDPDFSGKRPLNFLCVSVSPPLASRVVRFTRPPWDSSQPDKLAPCGCTEQRAAASLKVSH